MGRSPLLTTGPVPRSGSMSLGSFNHSRLHRGRLITTGLGHIRFEGRVMGVWLGNGFPDTCGRPVNTDLDLAGLPFTLCPPLLGISLIAGPGLAPSLLASCPLGFLFFVWLPPMVYFTRCHFRPGRPLIFLLGSWDLLSQSVKCRCPTGRGLSG